ncbi:hypothetical protein [Frankia gtarii]|uniref:hypothetical protein n=1 Tax=Frankia gtarii TaxID=2950102 RepID=UPI0021C1BD14|nr:hypothetical protein [Frankia gtarii]
MTGVQPPPDESSPSQGGAGGRPGPAQGRDAGKPDDSDAPPPGGWFGLRVLPAGWMRALLMTVTALVTVVVALGDLASAWVVGVLPLVVAAMVAYHEVLDRMLHPADRDPADRDPADSDPATARNPPGDPATR